MDNEALLLMQVGELGMLMTGSGPNRNAREGMQHLPFCVSCTWNRSMVRDSFCMNTARKREAVACG